MVDVYHFANSLSNIREGVYSVLYDGEYEPVIRSHDVDEIVIPIDINGKVRFKAACDGYAKTFSDENYVTSFDTFDLLYKATRFFEYWTTDYVTATKVASYLRNEWRKK